MWAEGGEEGGRLEGETVDSGRREEERKEGRKKTVNWSKEERRGEGEE